MSAIFQPANIGEILIAGVPLPATALAAPISMRSNKVKSWHIFCLHTIGATPEDPKKFESLEAMRKVLLLDEKCTRLGRHVVYFTKPKSFIKRVHSAIEAQGYTSESRLVSYFDDLLYSGRFQDSDIPFKKPKRFSYQKEYRIVARTPPSVGSPLVLDVGNISDIAVLTTAEEFNASLTIQLKRGA